MKSSEGMNGFQAWQSLHRKNNPKTMARMIRLLVEVICPAKINGIEAVETHVAEWEAKCRKLEQEYGESFNEKNGDAVIPKRQFDAAMALLRDDLGDMLAAFGCEYASDAAHRLLKKRKPTMTGTRSIIDRRSRD